MVIILCICLVVAITVALYYRSKADMFEFELSERYRSGWNNLPKITHNTNPEYDMLFRTNVEIPLGTKIRMRQVTADTGVVTAKYNKDGSIAKKRGRKPKNVASK